ncbi:MAG: helix-turn-helix transcriptional regulator [Nitrosomonadales bacterium]|nr:helix-turn-helix transcriptional regulator [Nitrosomonadales bacterium]
MIEEQKTVAEWERELGEQLRALRLKRNEDQIAAAEGAGVSVSALKRLENGKGATMKTFIKALRYYGRTDWLLALSPPITVSPLQMARRKPSRQRASSPRKKLSNE